MTKRRSFSDKFKATMALEALRRDRTAQEIAAKHKVHPTQVTTWKRQAIDRLTGVFSDKVRRAEDNEAEVKELHAKIGKLAVESDFVRRQGFWNQRRLKLRESSAHLVDCIMQRAGGDASVALRVSFV
ncbi:transposase [Sulfitobacter sp.]|uniref:transposase n=1 Tax=Sulfitobacter sp. TaxID=1903071 RepID=UPI00300104BF